MFQAKTRTSSEAISENQNLSPALWEKVEKHLLVGGGPDEDEETSELYLTMTEIRLIETRLKLLSAEKARLEESERADALQVD